MPKIFISYRRSDSKDIAGRIYDRLVGRFGEDSVFYDKKNVPYGIDYRKWLKNEVQSCQVLIAIIGSQWLDAQDQNQKRRIDSENDWVRIEIESALAREDIPVIPLLVNGAKLPNPEQLPESLEKLAHRQAAKARTDDFDADMSRLITEIERHFGNRRPLAFDWSIFTQFVRGRGRLIAVAIALAMVAGGSYLGVSALAGLVRSLNVNPRSTTASIQDSSPATPVYSASETATRLISAGDNPDFEGISQLSAQYPAMSGAEKTYNALKLQGMREFSNGDYGNAVTTFSRIRELAIEQRDAHDRGTPEYEAAENALKDPEVLIFKNNAEVRRRHQQGQPIYTIAAAIPLTNAQGVGFSVGKDMLMGIAHAQDKAVDAEGDAPSEGDRLAMPRLNLEVLIANDRNMPDQAEVLAQVLTQSEQNVLAVVGHYLSSSTCQALDKGYQNNVAVISPLSTATYLRKCGSTSFFRTTSSTRVEASTLIGYLEKYLLEVLNKDVTKGKVAIFYNEEDRFSEDLFQEFRVQLLDKGIQIDDRIFKISEPNFDVQGALRKSKDVDALVVLPDGRNAGRTAFDHAIEIIKNSQDKIVLGSNPLYSSDVTNALKASGNPSGLEDYVNKLFLATDWHQTCAPDDFRDEIRGYWFGEVNRGTMLSYEAVQVLVHTIHSLDESVVDPDQVRETLEGLAEGSGGIDSHIFVNKTISFDDNGDRREINPRLLATVDGDTDNPFGVFEDECL